jgi:hypothetical protein
MLKHAMRKNGIIMRPQKAYITIILQNRQIYDTNMIEKRH